MFDRFINTVRSMVLAARGNRPASEAERTVRRPQAGRIVVPMKDDAERDWVSIGLTPAKLVSLLKEFDAGDLGRGMQLAEQMEEKDGHIYSVAGTRRLALTGLEWEIASAGDVDNLKDRGQADEAAEFCRETLSAIEGFEPALEHLALAVGRNLSVCELVWGADGLEDVAVVPQTRLLFKTDQDAPELRVLTAEQQQNGVAMDPAKWIVHTPQCVGGVPMRGGLLRLTAAAYVAKAFSLKDWLVFVELFGMPLRVARYEPGATAEEKRELLDMLRSLGTDAAAVFSKAVEIEMKEASQKNGEAPFERVADFFNAELSKAWLGQTLTTEVGDSGSRALGDVHNQVRKDLLAADIKAEGRTVRRDLLRWLTVFQFGPECPVPYFRRKVEEAKDLTELADNVGKAVDLGVMVDRTWFASELGITTTDKPEEALTAPAKPELFAPAFKEGRGTGCCTAVLVDSDQAAADAYADQAVPAFAATHAGLVSTIGEWLDAAIAAGIDTPAALGGWMAAQIAAGAVPTPTAAADVIGQVLLAANLQGRLAMRERMGRRASRSFALAEAQFTNLPFARAIAGLAERVRMGREEFDQLSRQAKSKAFTVAWVDSARMLADIHEAAITAMVQGETLRDFRLRLPEMADTRGWSGERPWHADLVLRQQTQMATQAGRFSEMADSGITRWRYSSLLDTRVRPEHAALDGKVFAMSDRRFYPPWDFNCRCVAEPVFEDELGGRVERSEDLLDMQIGSNPETGQPIRLRPPGGENPFAWDPAAFAASPRVDLGNVSIELRSALKTMLNAAGIETQEQ